MHYFPQKVVQKSQNSFVGFHSDNFFGIAIIDVDLTGKKKKYWKWPEVEIKTHNKRKIRVTKNDDSE